MLWPFGVCGKLERGFTEDDKRRILAMFERFKTKRSRSTHRAFPEMPNG
jgi:hypothetical protein